MTTVTWETLMDKAKEPQLPAAGVHFVECVDAEHTVSSTNKEMIKVQYLILTGPDKGAKVFSNFVLSPDNDTALGFLVTHLEAHGLQMSNYRGRPEEVMEELASDLIGKKVEVTVRHKNYEGRKVTDVRSFNKPRQAKDTEPTPKPKTADSMAPPPPPLASMGA